MNDGCFKKGNTPWNKGMKGLRLSPGSEFKKGEKTMQNHPSWKGGVQLPKDDCAYLNLETNTRVRRPRHIYEKHYGTIPIGFVIFHKDGDKTNDEISNLEAISRAELIKRNNERK